MAQVLLSSQMVPIIPLDCDYHIRKSEDKIFQPSHNVKKQGKLLKEQ